MHISVLLFILKIVLAMYAILITWAGLHDHTPLTLGNGFDLSEVPFFAVLTTLSFRHAYGVISLSRRG